MAHRRLYYAFLQWADGSGEHAARSAKRQAMRKQAFSRMLNGHLTAAFVTWYDFVNTRLWALEKARGALQRLLNEALARSLATWIQYAEQLANVIHVAQRMREAAKCALRPRAAHAVPSSLTLPPPPLAAASPAADSPSRVRGA